MAWADELAADDFNSRPHGGRRSSATSSLHSITISTHALTEGDAYTSDRVDSWITFQLTPSRRATKENRRDSR